ncbi:MAG: OmpA family protein [Pseudomonadota bacterium]
MKLRAPLFAVAFAATLAQAADPAPAAVPAFALPWPLSPVTAKVPPDTPKSPEEWMTRITDFTRNASAYKDPRVFVPWSHAVTEPGFYLTAVKGAMEPGGWLNMMNSAAHPDALRNYLGFSDPNIYTRWLQAGVDPAFYTAMLTQFTDPGKMMRWAMVPLDPRVLDIMLATVNPNTYMRWGMAAMDPRTWNFMGTVMNPALYTSMLGTLADPDGAARSSNPWLSWRPAPVMGASSPWGADPIASFNMFDPALLSNMAAAIPGLSSLNLPALPNLTLPTMPTMPSLPSLGVQAPGAPALPATPPAQAAPAKSAAQAPVLESPRTVLGADTLFKSGRASVKDMTKEGKAKLDEVAAKIKSAGPVEQIRIVGHADVMGKPKANLKLSERRARAVKSYLVAKGVKPGMIITSGVGDTQPVVQCDEQMPKAERIACLAPNRRVEVEVVAKAQ